MKHIPQKSVLTLGILRHGDWLRISALLTLTFLAYIIFQSYQNRRIHNLEERQLQLLDRQAQLIRRQEVIMSQQEALSGRVDEYIEDQ